MKISFLAVDNLKCQIGTSSLGKKKPPFGGFFFDLYHLHIDIHATWQ